MEDTTSTVLAGYGGPVALADYGGPIDPAPLPEPEPVSPCHYNQGIGNGAEGGDPGKSRPHGGSNDEGGRTPGRPADKDPITGSKGCDALVGSKGSDSWTCKDNKSSKDPIVPNVVILGKTPCGVDKGIDKNLFNLGCGSSSKSSDSKDCRSNAPISFGASSCNPLHRPTGCGSNFGAHA